MPEETIASVATQARPAISRAVRAEASCGFTQALEAWRVIVGEAHVCHGGDVCNARAANTLGLTRTIPAVIRPADEREVQETVRVALRHRIEIYPASTGRNWGNGCALPSSKQAVLLDLSRMNRIRSFDPELGVVTLEPGVTQGQLHDFLGTHGHAYLVPTSGAGRHASILGNAVERGYGLTPCGDHFAHTMSLEAVLPDGSLYRSALLGSGGIETAQLHKWGVGPYLDGLFSQSSLGIVTAMTIALTPRPERMEGFFLALRDDACMEPAVAAVQTVLRRLRGILGPVNLMNRRRMLSMMEPYPEAQVAPGAIMPEDLCERLAAPHRIPAWTVAGALFGTKDVVKAARHEIKRAFAPLARHALFVTPERIGLYAKLSKALPFVRNSRLPGILERLEAGVANFCGRPTDVALPLAYWRSKRPRPSQPAVNLSRDASGLLWYTPLVPMRSDTVRAYVRSVERICSGHGVEPLITLTSLSDRCFDSTVPVLFDKHDGEATSRAWRCFRMLFEENRKQGWVPYRGGLQNMDMLVLPEEPGWRLARRIKQALDPQGLLAPNRYA